MAGRFVSPEARLGKRSNPPVAKLRRLVFFGTFPPSGFLFDMKGSGGRKKATLFEVAVSSKFLDFPRLFEMSIQKH
jgi:hypothetical protein